MRLFNARSGIKVVVDSLQPRQTWVPSYLCPTILTAIDPHITDLQFYPINEKLDISSFAFHDDVKAGDLFIFIDYFGFQINNTILQQLRDQGVYLLQDCSQNLFYDWRESAADFILYSPRKFLGVPDGGILHTKATIQLDHPDLAPPPQETFMDMFTAVVQRREFDLWGGDREWRECFDKAEKVFSAGYHAMSELTEILLNQAFDYEQIISQRRDNYKTLSTKLSRIALFPELPEDVVPLGFPVVLENRDQVQQQLFRSKIYPPIHWHINGLIPPEYSESHALSSSMLTLPCDQRYQDVEMDYLAESVLKAIS